MCSILKRRWTDISLSLFFLFFEVLGAELMGGLLDNTYKSNSSGEMCF